MSEQDRILYEHEQRYTSVDLTKPIDRGAFLQARMAYMAQCRVDGMDPIEAVNLSDRGQVNLLLMTWDDSRAREQRMRARDRGAKKAPGCPHCGREQYDGSCYDGTCCTPANCPVCSKEEG